MNYRLKSKGIVYRKVVLTIIILPGVLLYSLLLLGEIHQHLGHVGDVEAREVQGGAAVEM